MPDQSLASIVDDPGYMSPSELAAAVTAKPTTRADELLPFPEDDDMSPSWLAADITAADERERTALEQRLIDVGFDEVSITEEGVDIWRFDLVHRGRGSEAFGFLDGILEQSSLVLDQSTLETKITRTLTTASFLCSRSHDFSAAFDS